MNIEKFQLSSVIKWFVILTMPFFLGFGVATLVIAWDYPAFEYPRIESDRYGWSDEDRLALATATLDYIQDPRPAEEAIVMLEELRLPEDSSKSLYNEREIGHMLDVKILFDQIQMIFWALAVLIPIGLVYFFAQENLRPEGADAVYKGGLATVIALTPSGRRFS